jgi:ribulose-bisphosphate carboxylase large chain
VSDVVTAVYEIHGDGAHERAKAIAVEQSHELPTQFAPKHSLVSLAHVVDVVESAGGPATATIEFPVELAGGELTQLLVMLFGNVSLQRGVRLVEIDVPAALATAVGGGTRLGVDGVRQVLGAPERPLLATALKPVGLSSRELADMAHELALGGIDLIKDDQGVNNQHWSPFAERVPLVADAVRRANEKTGRTSLYLPTVSGPHLDEHARLAGEAGVGGALVMPGIDGFSAPLRVAAALGRDAIVLQHPSFLGGFTADDSHGIAPELLFGRISRLVGADVVVFPNSGGRFGLTEAQCRAIAAGATGEFAGLRPALPAPGGGMTVEKVPAMLEQYGRDVVQLIGGDLHRDGDVRGASERFRAAALA